MVTQNIKENVRIERCKPRIPRKMSGLRDVNAEFQGKGQNWQI